MYKIQTKVRYSECGDDGKITLSSIINHFQDTSSVHSESLGVGVDYLMERKRAWILNSWQIVIKRYPKIHEEIEISTWPTGLKGVFGPRDFCMKTLDGEMLACAHTLWVYMDMEKKIPAKPGEEEKNLYKPEPPLEVEYAPRKIKLPEEAEVVDTVFVRKYQIDTNSHMNNCQYVQLAAEVLPDDFVAGQVRVEYKKSAVYGDKIVIKKAEEAKRIVVELCDACEVPYAAVEFIGE